MLYLISLGLETKDISLKSLEIAKSCDILYLENYTSLGSDQKELEKTIGKPIKIADRALVESDELVKQAKNKKIALLIHGDALSATTHLSLIDQAIAKKVPCQVTHSSSVLTAVSETGLSLYKFGAIGSIPFQNQDIKSPYQLLEKNDSINLHTLFLLDLDPENKKYLTPAQAISYLTKQGMDPQRPVILCSNLGTQKQKIIFTKAKNIPTLEPPFCLIIPSELNFFEKEFLNRFKIPE